MDPDRDQLSRITDNDKEAGATASAALTAVTLDPSSAFTTPGHDSSFQLHKYRKEQFYSFRDGAFERALEDVRREVYKPAEDGNWLGAWLLFEVDHWDNETEKIVVLTDEWVFSVRYDFVPMKVYKHKRLSLKSIDTVQIGDFKYPQYSLITMSSDMRRRKCGGIRLLWNKGVEPNLLQKWRPSSDAMPWTTFTFHPLIYVEDAQNKSAYNVEEFAQSLIRAINLAYDKHNPGRMLVVKEAPLEQQVYIGLPSQVHNQSFLGMSKERGGISF